MSNNENKKQKYKYFLSTQLTFQGGKDKLERLPLKSLVKNKLKSSSLESLRHTFESNIEDYRSGAL